MIIGIHGINIAVRDLEAATEKYERIFGVPGKPVDEDGFAFPGLRGSALDVNGFNINLITSTAEDTSVAKFLARQGEGVFLLSLLVDDMEATTAELEEKGVTPLLNPAASGAFGSVNFVHPKEMHGIQIELFKLPEEASTGAE